MILNSTKQSTRKSYAQKWSKFCRWIEGKHLHPNSAGLSVILDFLLHLKDNGLSYSSLKVYLVTLSAYHVKIESFSAFSHPTTKCFMKGLLHTFPPRTRKAQTWDLALVLRCLTRAPFEPAASCELKMLSWKTLFLVAITSARRVSELAALDSRPPFMVFQPHAVQLSTNISFLPKVVSEFHINSEIILPDFCPNPATPRDKLYHTLDVTKALKYYLHRTRFSDRHSALFVSYSKRNLGERVSSQRLSRWVVGLICLCYSLSKVPLPIQISAHSTRAMAASQAFLRGIPLHEICKAATWRTPTTFIRHYAIESRAAQAGAMGRAVLRSGLH